MDGQEADQSLCDVPSGTAARDGPQLLSFAERLAQLKAMPPPVVDEAAILARTERELARTRRYAWESVFAVMGRRYAGCTLANWIAGSDAQRRVLAAVTEYAASMRDRLAAGEGLVLYGPVGTGKDHLAVGVLRKALDARLRIGALNCQDWFGELRDRIDAGDSEASAISCLVRPEVLLLSDPLPPIGAITQHQATMLYRLVDDRYSRGKVTIVTLNVESDEEADRCLGSTTWDRLCDRAWKIACRWESYRHPAREID